MIQIVKWIVIIIFSCALDTLGYLTESKYLTGFFSENAILLGGAVFAIHAASVGILIGQLSILCGKGKFNFSKTISSIRYSFIESFICLSMIFICAIFQKTPSLLNINIIVNKDTILPLIQIFCITDLLYIIYDSVNAILISFEELINNDNG